MKIYLAHGHHHRPNGKWLQHQLELWGYKIINPFDHDQTARKLTRDWFNAQQANDKPQLEKLAPLIYHKDKGHILNSDAILVYYPDESTGTSQEIEISREAKKPIIVLTDLIHPFTHTKTIVLPLNTLDTMEGLLQIRKLFDSGFKIKGEELE